MNEQIEIKNINVKLIKDNSLIKLRFMFENQIDLNLQNEDMNEVKRVFLLLANELKTSRIVLEYDIDKSIDQKNDELFIETASEYINQLNIELLTFENDEDLRKIRNIALERNQFENSIYDK